MRMVLVGFLVVCEWGRFGISLGVGSGGCLLMLVICGLGVVSEVVWLRMWSVGEGFHVRHWNMMSWFGLCTRVLRGFLFWWVERVVAGGFISLLGRSIVKRVMGEWQYIVWISSAGCVKGQGERIGT